MIKKLYWPKKTLLLLESHGLVQYYNGKYFGKKEDLKLKK